MQATPLSADLRELRDLFRTYVASHQRPTIAAARRVLAAPEREAVRVSTFEIIAMSRLIVDQAHGDPSQPSTQETVDV